MTARHRFKRGDAVLYKGHIATYMEMGERADLCIINMDRKYVMDNCREISYQRNVDYWRSSRTQLHIQVTERFLKVPYRTNQEAKSLLEVEY